MSQIDKFKKSNALFFLITILISCFLVTSCKKYIQNMDNKEEKQKDYIQKKRKEVVISNQDNTVFDYSKKNTSQVNTGLESSKKIDINKMIKDYEDAINELDNYSKKLIKNPKLSEDKKFKDNMMTEAAKVRELFQALNKLDLNVKQKKKFQELSYMK